MGVLCYMDSCACLSKSSRIPACPSRPLVCSLCSNLYRAGQCKYIFCLSKRAFMRGMQPFTFSLKTRRERANAVFMAHGKGACTRAPFHLQLTPSSVYRAHSSAIRITVNEESSVPQYPLSIKIDKNICNKLSHASECWHMLST